MIESAMVFDEKGLIIYWHDPPGASSSHIPDSKRLWNVLWNQRHRLGGVAHTHPWDGPTEPSGTDLSTFKAVEAGLGQRLIWPIVTMTHINYFTWEPNSKEYFEIQRVDFRDTHRWMSQIMQLRLLSRGG
jgi:hypothetical protein